VSQKQRNFETRKESVKIRQPPARPILLEPLVGGIEEQLPSFLFGSAHTEFKPFATPGPEEFTSSSSPEENNPPKLEPKPAPPRAPISAWSITPQTARPVPAKAPTPKTEPNKPVSTYPDLAAIACRPKETKQKDKGKGKGTIKAIKKPLTPPLQPIYDDEWTIAQPATVPARGRGGRVIQEDWGMEAIRQANEEMQRRRDLIAAGEEDPCGGW